MSNIPDITSLSDLLHTSPSQPSVENHRNRIPNSFLGQEDEQDQDQEQIHEPDQEQNHGDNRDVTNENETIQSQLEKSGLPDNKIEGLEKLLSQQSMKLDLSNERNDLVKKRSSLKASVEELRVKVKHLQSLNGKQKQKRKFDKLLEHNDKTFIESQKPKKVHAPANQDDNDYILNNLHVLPSNDWMERLNMVKRFYPYLEIDKARCTTSYDDKRGTFVRTISYVVLSPLLFRLLITVTINSSDESVLSIMIPNTDEKGETMTNFLLLSPSFTKVLIQNYILCKKIDLVMYSLNSLSIALHKRMSTFYKLLRKFRQYIHSGNYIDDLVKEQEIGNQDTIFSVLKSVDNIEFTIPMNSNKGHHFTMEVQWEIVIPNSINGDCASDLRLFLTKSNDLQKTDRKNSSRGIEGANSLFLRLSKEYGIFNAVCILFNNIFNIYSD